MRVNRIFLIAILSLSILGTSCVSKKKYTQQLESFETLEQQYSKKQSDLNACITARDNYIKQIEDLNRLLAEKDKETDNLTKANTMVLNQLETLSVISSSQAESIRQSMENIGMKDAYIQNLQMSIAKKDSLNMALVMNLKSAIGNLDDEDVNIKVDKGVIYVDISDKLLFASGSYKITDRAKEVLGKVAKVLKNQPDIHFMVEGHTDNVPYPKRDGIYDNWDLSVKRATTVVRLLQNEYGMDPSHITAAGRGEYSPVDTNSTADGRAKNRRTRIVIQPELDQFFKLLETPQQMKK
ncbi:MAG: OmpA family protein [Lentimicrobiaceae bacterium]|nr:OmpA family protein [Lentimicrobiaceae bacterium]